jgi:hypothetical protein
MSIHSTLVTLAALALLAGCSSGTRDASSLREGEMVVAHLALHEDGSLEATAIDVADEDDDDVDCEQEGEHEGENEGCGLSSPPADMIVGATASGAVLEALGIAVTVGDVQLPAGQSHWFRGRYLGSDQFDGELVKSSSNEQLRVLGKVTAVDAGSTGVVTIEIFDRSISADGAMPVNQVNSLEEAGEADVVCEQEGEHEGENAGC